MANRPNIVLFLTDTQGINVLGCYGVPGMRTPHIDALAGAGTRFDRAYTTCPLCTPARAGLFTGVYAHNSGAWANSIPLYANTRTMAAYMGELGYHCAYAGKWHLSGHDYFDTGVCADGWDPSVWYDGKNYLDDLSPDEIALVRQAGDDPTRPPDARITSELTWAHRVSDRGIDFLRREHAQPFCLVLSYDEPHHPWACPREFFEPFAGYRHPPGPSQADDLSTKPHIQRLWREWVETSRWGGAVADGDYHLPLFFACNSFVDHLIGRVIAELDRLGLDESTWVVFTSDHGDMMGQHRLLTKGACMYEAATHIPLLMRAPTASAAPTPAVVSAPVSHADLLPTFLRLAGGEAPAILDGHDLAPLLRGDPDPHRAVVIEFNRFEVGHDSCGGFQPIRAIVRDQYKLALNLLSTDELYDLEQDPHELQNLIDSPDHAAVRQDLHRQLLEWMNARRDPFRGFAWDQRPWGPTLNLNWTGPYRKRPDDGAWPAELSYLTGLPLP